MSDIQVEIVQRWLQINYTGRKEFDSLNLKVNGISNHYTVEALIMALQYEIGIKEPTGTFGPMTLSTVPTLSIDNNNSANKKIVQILSAGLWCHGYSPGYTPGDSSEMIKSTIDDDFVKGIKKIQKDIGITQDGIVDKYLWKAILSSDAYTTTWTEGNVNLQNAQRIINNFHFGNFHFAKDYLGCYIPCDGVGGRTLSNAIITFIQANIGLSPEEATGFLGEYTKKNLSVISVSTSENEKNGNYIYAITFALLANGYDIFPVRHFDFELKKVIKQFQIDMLLKETGEVNKSTWMALLISHGDPNRTPNAADMSCEVTESRLQYLLNNDIEAVGRYITGTTKRLVKEELNRITEEDIRVFPIFQTSGDEASYFNEIQGAEDSKTAVRRTMDYGFSAETIIYFAVDFDALNYQIDELIIPYFKGINDGKGTFFKIGIYGTRNVCSRVMNAGLATTCFVSNMSSGYSGNLGFKMPNGWELDQYNEYWVGGVDSKYESDTEFDIDKVMFRNGHFTEICVRPYKRPKITFDANRSTVISSLFTLVNELEDLVFDYTRLNGTNILTPDYIIQSICYLIRSIKYDSLGWKAFLHSDENLLAYVKKNSDVLERMRLACDDYYIVDNFDGIIDFVHLFASIDSHISFVPGQSDWGSWVGDAMTFCEYIKINRSPEYQQMNYDAYFAAGSELPSSFNFDDLCADTDAILIADKIKNINKSLEYKKYSFSEILKEYYNFDAQYRFPNFIKKINGYYEGIDRYTFAEKVYNHLSSVSSLVPKSVFAPHITNTDLQKFALTFSNYFWVGKE